MTESIENRRGEATEKAISSSADIKTILYLQDKWVIKARKTADYSKGQSASNWSNSFSLVAKFNTVESLWKSLNFGLAKTMYSFFKEGIEPAWEDDKNKNGCSFHFYSDDDEFKLDLLLLIVGGTVPFYEFVNGYTIDVKRSNYKLSIWFSVCEDKLNLAELIKAIGREPDKIEKHTE